MQATCDAAAEEGTYTELGDASKCEAPVGFFHLLKEWLLVFRLAVLLLNWFALFLNYYGIGLGSGGIPGSM